jgi:penicillin amidase
MRFLRQFRRLRRSRVAAQRLLAHAIALATMSLLAGCNALYPEPIDTATRLAMFPVTGLPIEQPIVIRWNAQQVPYIEAQTDRDLAFALGLVHAHLRGGQLALLKRIARGRLSEMVGPLAQDIDHALRILDYGHAAPETLRRMPAETRAWIDAFVAGLNHYQAQEIASAPELALLGVAPEPWTAEDVLAIGRLAGTDVNWLAYFSLLRERNEPGFEALWARTLEAGANATTSFRARRGEAFFADLLTTSAWAGSNSVVVSGARSATGAALIASDPHLGLALPNYWLLVGIKSPSLHAVGLMVPGVPILGLGRNPDLAWGGTNLRAASSDLYDVTGLPPAVIRESTVTIRTRAWPDATRTVRRTPFGPIITDATVIPSQPGEVIALRWVGHEPTDEVGAFLQAMRASTPEAFRAAFAGFGVPGQNMLVAASDGRIAHVIAVTQPRRARFPPRPDPVLDATDPANAWQGFATTPDLPAAFDPPEGFLASANNRPTDGPVPLGFFFSDDERVRRLQALLAARDRIGVGDLKALQNDTFSADAQAMNALFLQELERLPGPPVDPAFIARLRGWDGDYAMDSRGAVAFETLLFHLVPPLYGAESIDGLAVAVNQWNFLTAFLARDLAALPAARREALLRDAAGKAAADASRFETWGDMHRLSVAHLLRNLPLVGRRFVIADLPVGGSRETPMKSAHGLVNARHDARYGSQARHISDLSDPDANWFVLLGGQDGWLGSANYADQLTLWRNRGYLRMPLRAETVAREFPIVLQLAPADR